MNQKQSFVFGGRTTSRLGAVQALYQLDIDPISPSLVIEQFKTYHFCQKNTYFEKVDKSLFEKIVLGVWEDRLILDPLISQSLAHNWNMNRLEAVIKAILRAGTYELLGKTNVPKPIVINEYVTITKAFFSNQEPAFVNASLDHLAKQVINNA